MKRNLRLICPLGILLLVLLVFGCYSMNSKAIAESTTTQLSGANDVTLAERTRISEEMSGSAAEPTVSPAASPTQTPLAQIANEPESAAPSPEATAAPEPSNTPGVFESTENGSPVGERDETPLSTTIVHHSLLTPIETAGSGYTLSEQERKAVEMAVMREAGNECYEGQMMVAQCILDGAQRNSYSVTDMIRSYQVCSTSDYSEVTYSVKQAVAAVFDRGERITERKTDLWYNPDMVTATWHEGQEFVIAIGNHKFFWMNEDDLPQV